MKDWVQFLLCALLSAGIWFVYNMSGVYSDVVPVSIEAESEIEGRDSRSSTEAVLAARIKASGFKLVSLYLAGKKGIHVKFDPEDFEPVGSDQYSISSPRLTKYVSAIYGDGVSLESFASDALVFRFPVRTFRKVPVRAVASIDFKAQYMSAKGLEFTPDSVAVYGEPDRLESVEYVLTRPISLKDVSSARHGIVSLEIPKGLSCGNASVDYKLDVTRFVELERTFRIGVRNVPSYVRMLTLPSQAKVLFRCVFPMEGRPVEEVSLYVDYAEFAGSLSGNCLIHADGIPEGVVQYEIEPQVCECFEQR